MNFLATFVSETWIVLNEAAPFVLFGFLVSALVKALVPDDFVARHLGRSSSGSVFKAALLGIPLPLCSCGVIPTAAGLRKQGASRGATTSFLISTPETGADSIAVTWALLDPIMTVLRPLAAFITATVAGLLVNILPDEPEASRGAELPMASSCGCSGGCCETDSATAHKPPFLTRLKDALRYAFGEMLSDIGMWLLIGVLAAGFISALVPAGFFEEYLGGEFASLVIMMVVGVPLYVCATSSTPIAASMALKGLSPGAALVFLLAGPATNTATIAVVARILGRKAVAVYIGAIALCALGLGWLTNRLYAALGTDISAWMNRTEVESVTPFTMVCAIALVVLVLLSKRQSGNTHAHDHSHDHASDCCH